MKTCVSLLLLFFPSLVICQGLIMDDDRYDEVPIQSAYNDGSKSEENALSGKSTYSLKAYCPKVEDQGKIATCVGWAVGYAALSIQQAVKNEWKGQQDVITENAFSSMFIFNQIKITDCNNGSFIDSAMSLLQRKGNIRSADFDTDKSDCLRMPSNRQMEEAAEHKIVDYMALFRRNAPDRIKINKVKLSLLENKPVIFGLMAPKSFSASSMAGKAMWFPSPGERGIFGHALTVIGYDDAQGAFEVMNSWGEAWGEGGFTWIRYQDFAKYASYAFQMSLDEKIEKQKVYSGKCAIRQFVTLMSDGEAVFKDVSLALNARRKVYQPKNQAEGILRGKVFQLIISQVSAGMYLYAFGMEADGEMKSYFPKENESPKITVPEVELFIPGPESGIQFTKVGREYLILLFSTKPIENIEEKLAAIRAKGGSLVQRIYDVFGEAVIPQDYMGYSQRYMQFQNEMPEGEIIPMVLELNISK
ncbi:MAG: C1 family peptidase [Bacteroidia bacterium]|nr:C1 family peptidase [Bacteroidia bacterium]